LAEKLEKLNINSSDHLVILGDAGIVWSANEHLEIREYYDSLPCKVLFVDGNHENFDLLDAYPTTEFGGGAVHKITDNIFHLMRGEAYEIENKRIFVFGGGFSLKKLTNTSPIFVWDREMPSDEEYQNGTKNLARLDYQVDCVFTHVAPTSVVKQIGVKLADEERCLNDYLNDIKDHLEYKSWFFGHHHKDVEFEKHFGVYERVLTIGD
jgi:hypothetical protein